MGEYVNLCVFKISEWIILMANMMVQRVFNTYDALMREVAVGGHPCCLLPE